MNSVRDTGLGPCSSRSTWKGMRTLRPASLNSYTYFSVSTLPLTPAGLTRLNLLGWPASA